ncbi:protein kinase [Bifidobacterium sp. ESL0763]|nr:serine/threonine protein kinase [Bifidobacterium sp. ESL0763]MDF7663087.1 protein kinase [Bifidobacterium sp. ESL0763]
MSDLNALNLKPGALVGGYTLISRLGSGAMGSVWRVRDDGGQVYAMKILRDSLKNDDDTADIADGDNYAPGQDGQLPASEGEFPHRRHRRDPQLTARERLRREAMALRRVRHPGVCAIVDMELDDSLAFIVTELIEGRNLRDDVAANGRYVGEDLERLARKLIEAVRAVHAQGVIHRDIKPTNIMVSAAGPVLVDFGIAMSAGESHVTRTGLVMGTPGFIAPEIIDGAESGEATDWWSLASVLAFAATGRPVFGSKPMMTVLEREASGNANLAGLPARTLAAFRSALDPDPGRRCTPEELLRAITLDSLNPFEADGDEDTAVFGDDGNDSDGGNGGSTGNPGAMPPFSPSGPARDGTGAPPPPNASGKPANLNTTDNPSASDAATETLHQAATGDPSNPRSFWRGDKTGQEAMTQIIATAPRANRASSAARRDPSPDDGSDGSATRALSPQSPPTRSLARESGTRMLATADGVPETQAFTTAYGEPATQAFTTADGEPLTQAFPALDRSMVQPLRPAPQATNEDAAPSYPSAQYAQQAPAAEPMSLAQNPADLRRQALISRSTLPLWLLALPIAALAAALPTVSALLVIVLLWLLLAIGHSEMAQLRREEKRGGARRRHDAALRMLGLPWHVLKALLLTVPRALLVAAIAWLAPIVVDLVSGMPTANTFWTLGGWNLDIPVPTAPGASFSGGMQAVFALAAWLVVVFTARPEAIRIGMGTLWGLKRDPAEETAPAAGENGNPNDSVRVNGNGEVIEGQENGMTDDNADIMPTDGETASGPRRRHAIRRGVVLALGILALAVAIVLLAQGRPIDFFPLPTPDPLVF